MKIETESIVENICITSPERTIKAIEKAMKLMIYEFKWSSTPQGHEYWKKIVKELGGLIDVDWQHLDKGRRLHIDTSLSAKNP